jgi:hypothetical protein
MNQQDAETDSTPVDDMLMKLCVHVFDERADDCDAVHSALLIMVHVLEKDEAVWLQHVIRFGLGSCYRHARVYTVEQVYSYVLINWSKRPMAAVAPVKKRKSSK